MIKHLHTGMHLRRWVATCFVRNRTQVLLLAWVCPSGKNLGKIIPLLIFFNMTTHLEKDLCGIAMIHVVMRWCVMEKCSSVLVLWNERAQFPPVPSAYVWIFAC